MLKKVPIMPVFFFSQQKCPFLTITNTYSTFHGKSEGLGDFSLLNNETTWTSTSWPGSWESSGSLPKLLTAAGPLLPLVLGPLSLDSMLLLGPAVHNSIWRALHVHYSRKTAWLFHLMLLQTDYYAGMLDASLEITSNHMHCILIQVTCKLEKDKIVFTYR